MLNKKTLQLNQEFVDILDALEKTTDPYFITGRAGTGKSTLLGLFRNTTRKKVIVLAPTGIAALNVKGQTIHSFFGFPPKPITPKDIRRRRNSSLYKKLDMIVIDEISMVRADMLDNIDYFLRLNRNDPRPFGGVQMVFFGDLFQLPPVVSTNPERILFTTIYESPYFFSANVMSDSEFDIQYFELNKVFRQEQRRFLNLLEAIRLNQADYDTLEDLNERYEPEFQAEDYYITLSARNATVNSINNTQLSKLDSTEIAFMAKVKGHFNESAAPATPILKLKLGAQIMFVKNDPDKNFYNGTIGKIVELTPDKIVVSIINDQGEEKQLKVEKDTWEIERYILKDEVKGEITTETIGTFTQYPIKLAWAMTIHKSQGKTFDRVIIDMKGGAFEHGQTYVALSRCRTFEGVILKNRIQPRDIQVDERVVQYYESYF